MPETVPLASRHAVRIAVAASLLFALLLGATPAAADAGGIAWSVQTADNENGTGRGSFSYDVEPGQVITDTMVVMNTGTVALPLGVYAADAYTTTTGNIDVLAGDTPSVDAGAWLTPTVDSIALGPGESVDIAFTITVPADATPGDHSAALVTSLVSEDASQSLEVDRRLGTRVNLRVAGELVPEAAVEIVATDAIASLNPFAPTTLRLTYRIENTGNTRVTGSERVEAHTIAGLLGTRILGPQLPEILPRSTVEIVRELPLTSLGWVGGTVTVAAEGVGLGAGGIEPATVQFSTIAVPWSMFALILLVAGGTVGVLVWVRRSQRRPEPAVAESPQGSTED